MFQGGGDKLKKLGQGRTGQTRTSMLAKDVGELYYPTHWKCLNRGMQQNLDLEFIY